MILYTMQQKCNLDTNLGGGGGRTWVLENLIFQKKKAR